jgi:hypothetical protein
MRADWAELLCGYYSRTRRGAAARLAMNADLEIGPLYLSP